MCQNPVDKIASTQKSLCHTSSYDRISSIGAAPNRRVFTPVARGLRSARGAAGVRRTGGLRIHSYNEKASEKNVLTCRHVFLKKATQKKRCSLPKVANKSCFFLFTLIFIRQWRWSAFREPWGYGLCTWSDHHHLDQRGTISNKRGIVSTWRNIVNIDSLYITYLLPNVLIVEACFASVFFFYWATLEACFFSEHAPCSHSRSLHRWFSNHSCRSHFIH